MKVSLAALALLLGIAAALLFTPQHNACSAGFCPDFTCYGPCGNFCQCLRRDTEGGVCVRLDLAPKLLDQGWTVVE